MSRREAGFTLLELLVALVVFGLVMVGITQSFRFGLSAFAAGERNVARPEDMAGMIARALPGRMTGTADGLAFTTRLPAGAGLARTGGLAGTALMLAPGGILLLRYTPYPPGLPLARPPLPRTELLARGVSSLAIAYLAPKAGGTPTWSAAWTGERLPLLVRIHCSFTDGRNWPDLVAAPVDVSE
jgi:general secretion pathway protein J